MNKINRKRVEIATEICGNVLKDSDSSHGEAVRACTLGIEGSEKLGWLGGKRLSLTYQHECEGV